MEDTFQIHLAKLTMLFWLWNRLKTLVVVKRIDIGKIRLLEKYQTSYELTYCLSNEAEKGNQQEPLHDYLSLMTIIYWGSIY